MSGLDSQANVVFDLDTVTAGKRLRELRESLSLSGWEFSERLHVSFGTLQLLENGTHSRFDFFLAKMCITGELRKEWFYTGVGSPHINEFPASVLVAVPTDFRIRLTYLQDTLCGSIKDVTRMLGIGASTWKMYLSGYRVMRESHIAHICSVLKVRRQWLCFGEGDMFTDTFNVSESACEVSSVSSVSCTDLLLSRLKSLRLALGLSVEELTECMGVGFPLWDAMESDFTQLNDSVFQRICSVFHVRGAWLEFGDGEMFEPSVVSEAVLLRLNALQSELACTPVEFARMVNFSISEWLGILGGYVELTPQDIENLCKGCHVNVDWLRSGEGSMFMLQGVVECTESNTESSKRLSLRVWRSESEALRLDMFASAQDVTSDAVAIVVSRLQAFMESQRLELSEFTRRLGMTTLAWDKLMRQGLPLSDLLMRQICYTFYISEGWLRFGVGSMTFTSLADESAKISGRLRMLRYALGFTQKEMGARVGVSGSSWGVYENGACLLRTAFVNSICDVFNVCSDWLFFGVGAMFADNEVVREETSEGVISDVVLADTDLSVCTDMAVNGDAVVSDAVVSLESVVAVDSPSTSTLASSLAYLVSRFKLSSQVALVLSDFIALGYTDMDLFLRIATRLRDEVGKRLDADLAAFDFTFKKEFTK